MPATREVSCYNDLVSKVMVYMGSDMTNLRVLVDGCKQKLLKDAKSVKTQPLNLGNKRLVISWLKSLCMKSRDGSIVCCYCGYDRMKG